MFLKPLKLSTDPRVRSLIQKAARRGFVHTVAAAAERLNRLKDHAWLRSRAVVITFEECWPLADELLLDPTLASKIEAIRRVAVSAKHKDAAGLGALAFAYSEGDKTTVQELSNSRPVRLVASALARPKAFFVWAQSECTSQRQRRIVECAQRYLPAATWGWDKACILAGAYLALEAEIPETEAVQAVEGGFPFWTALDKHTSEGKLALKKAAETLGLPARQVTWASFYFESALANKLDKSSWFECERTWRLRKAGLSVDAAERLWEKVRPLFQEYVASDAERLENELRDCAPHLRPTLPLSP